MPAWIDGPVFHFRTSAELKKKIKIAGNFEIQIIVHLLLLG